MAERKTIRPFGVKTNPPPARLKEFRNYVAQLKRKGILTGKIDPKVARPSFVRGGKKLGDIVNRHRDELKTYVPRAAKPTNSPSSKTPKAVSNKVPAPPVIGHKLPLNRPFSFRELPVKSKNLINTLEELERNSKEFDKLKKPDEFFAFKIDGVKSWSVFEDMELLVRRLSDYPGGLNHWKKRSDDAKILFDDIRIFRWNKTATEWKSKPDKYSKEKLARFRASQSANKATNRRKKK